MRHRATSRRRPKDLAVAAGVLLLGLAPASGGFAQLAAGPAGSNAPIDIEADTSTFDNASCTSVWSGAPEVLQGDTRLRAEVIKLFAKKKPQGPAPAKPTAPAPGQAPVAGEAGAGCGATDRVEAQGKVFYVTPTQTVHSDNAVYTADDGLIVMTGDVIVLQGKDVLHCDKMTIQVATRHVDCVSNAKGRGNPGRVRGVFHPGQPGQPGLPGLAPAASAAAPAAATAPAAAPPGGR